MKRSDRLKKEAIEMMDKIRSIARHIRNVEDNCLILGEKLIENGQLDLGKQLIANGYIHDASKFHGIEFEYLSVGNSTEEGAKLKQKLAIEQHRKTNPHHVEFWAKGINDMPEVYLCEMICDLKSRSEEFGTSLRDYIENVALKKWKITKDDLIYKKVDNYINLLCQLPFTEIK